MCRYAFHPHYRAHMACFACRKSFKTPHRIDADVGGLCPDCSGALVSMGLDFRAPRRDDRRGWAAAEALAGAGVFFHSCGCGGPGFRPTRAKQVPGFDAAERQRRESEAAKLLRTFEGRAPR